MCEVPESSMNSTETYNTLVGVSGDMNGNVIFGYTAKTAQLISTRLMGVDENEDLILDIFKKATLTDFYSEFCKRVANRIKTENMYNFKEGDSDYTLLTSNPTFIAGNNMYGIISKIPSKKLFFKVNGEKFGIAYSLE
jgi:CheY-specific phosphatase CheX